MALPTAMSLSSIKQSFARGKHQVLVKMGKTDKTVDSEFRAEKAKFEERFKNLKEFEKSLLKYEKAIRDQGAAHAELAVRIQQQFDPSSSALATAQYNSRLSSDLDGVKSRFEELYREKVLMPFGEYINQYKNIEKRIAERNLRLADMDRYNQELSVIQTREQKSGLPESAKAVAAREKAEDKAISYHALSDEIMQDFLRLEQSKEKFHEGIFAAVVEAQTAYFRGAAELLQGFEPHAHRLDSITYRSQTRIITDEEESLYKKTTEAAAGYNFDTHGQTPGYAPEPAQNYGAPTPMYGAPTPMYAQAPLAVGGPPIPARQQVRCRGKFPFAAQEQGELAFQVGDILLVHTQHGDWWEAELNGKKGLIPSNYVELI